MKQDNSLRQIRLNAAYRESEPKLKNSIQVALADPNCRFTFRHHSHQLMTKVKNASRYNLARTNGISVVIVESEKLDRPIFGYAVCSVQDTYSRLFGRVHALESLANKLKTGEDACLPLPDERTNVDVWDKHPHNFINYVIQRFAAKPPKVKPAPAFNPLLLVNEPQLTLEVKQLIAKKFGVDTKDIHTNFEYVRRFNNKFFEHQYASFENIQKYKSENPQDEITLDSTGGFTVAVFSFPVDGVKHLIYAASHCSIEDHFVKQYGRKTSLAFIRDSNLFKESPSKRSRSKVAGIFRLEHPMERKALLDNLTIYAVGQTFQVTPNHYVGG